MATTKAAEKKPRTRKLPVKDLSIWWSDLNSIPPEDKNEMWAAQMLFFMKRNCKLFLDTKRAEKYRATDRLELNEKDYKEMVDPTTPMGQGGTASYFSSDWKANPIYLHLKSIVKAEIEKTGKQLEINLTDKFAKTRRMRHNYTILYRNLFRSIINEYAPLVGLPQITENEDPFKWVKKFTDQKENDGTPANDVVDNYVDLIKNQIEDSQDLALYNELLYKGDYEMAFELGIEYFLLKLNKWQERYADDFIDDVMHFNKACGEWYTDLQTGRPVVERYVPERLWVSPFRKKDGEDLMYYLTEYEITFGDFAKTIGKNLTEEQLKKVFLYQKTQGGATGMKWADNINRPDRTRDNAMIRVGRAAALTQELYLSEDLPLSYVNATYPDYTQIPASWKMMSNGAYKIQKYYNCWYNWFYIPPSTNSLNTADYVWQAQFIFDIKKNQDQYRYGEDGRYSKPPLVIYDNSKQASFTDITQYYMPKINHASQKFQNCLVNDFEAVVLADEFLGGLLAAVDEGNKINPGNPNQATGNNRDAAMEQWKMIQQAGKGFLKMTDKNGQLILEPSKLVLNINNGYLEKAEKYIAMIALLYNEMVRALAQSSVTTGEEVKPRTPVAALEESVKASQNSIWAIQKGYETFFKMYGERMVQFIIQMCKEARDDGYTRRWQEFLDNIGYANGLAIEGMADVPPESVGMTVDFVDQTAKKEFIMQLATEYVKTQQLSEDFLNLLLSVDNWKVGFVLLRIGVKQRKMELMYEKEVEQKYIMQQKQADLQVQLTILAAKTQGKQAEIQTAGIVQDSVNKALDSYKRETQAILKNMTTQNRITETITKLDKENQIEQESGLVN